MTTAAPAEPAARAVPVWDFHDRVVLITGGSRGIGLAFTRLFAGAGASVFITGRKQDALDRVVGDHGEHVAGLAGSIIDAEHAQTAISQAIDRFGRLDMLVNNAAANPQYGPLADARMDLVDRTWEACLRAPLVWTRAAWHAWMGRHGGAVLNIASSGGLRAEAGLGAYNVAKAGVVALTRQLALEFAPGVRVNAVAPAVVRTDMSTLFHAGNPQLVERYALKRLGEPDDIAQAGAFLLSDAASWITGQTLLLDGGVDLTANSTQ